MQRNCFAFQHLRDDSQMSATSVPGDVSFLVFYLLLQRDTTTITKATYKGKHLLGDLHTVWKGESITIMVGSMVAGRYGAVSEVAVSESLHLIHIQKQGLT